MAASQRLRGVAFQLLETIRALAAASSMGETSAPAYAFEVCASESVLAALRASTSSAARRASVLRVACAPAYRSSAVALRTALELFAGEEPCLDSASAATDRPSSSITASSPSAPSASLLMAVYATDWVRASLAISPAAARRSHFFMPWTTALSELFSLTAAETRAAIVLFPFAPLIVSSSTTSAPTSLSPAVPELDVHRLINIINKSELNLEEEIRFRRAFNARFQSFRISDLVNYMENQTYRFEEMRFLLKAVYRKIGPHRDLMELLIKEDMLHGCSSEEELYQNPVLVRVEKELAIVNKKLDQQAAEILSLKEIDRNKKPDWFTSKVFGRKLDFTKVAKVISYIWRILGGGVGP